LLDIIEQGFGKYITPPMPLDTRGIKLGGQRFQTSRHRTRIGNAQQRAIARAPASGGNTCLTEPYDQDA
jgi:hypothetical protein